ncbi:MAG TPA: tetratricopeptide repeat protein [Thermoanaerobaculia bacterium]|nr:tetratricopeptide repeat protein [Thermoanaerobaculia bacterium]
MKAYVYTDKSLERYAGRFVWLAINTEDAANAAFLKQYPIPALPTLLVLDAKRGQVTLRYVGGATVPQVKKLLDEAEQSYRARSLSPADAALAKGDGLAAAGKSKEAVKAFDDAIAAAPKNWPRFGRTAESLIYALSSTADYARCATRALELYPRVKGTVSAANVASTGLACAAAVEPRNETMVEQLENATQEVFDDPKIVLSDDDRSGLYLALIDSRDAAGDDEGVVDLQTGWSAFLDQSAARAKTAEQRAVYDSHRLSAYVALGIPGKAIPMLEQSQRDFPNDYNPPARLAYAYKEMKEYDKALAASDRALELATGPRRIALLSTRADVYVAKGDAKTARETLEQAIAEAKALPEGQRSDRRIASLEKRLATIE